MSQETLVGWLERLEEPVEETSPWRLRFHQRRDCELVQDPDALVVVDRPWSAPVCQLCAGQASGLDPRASRRSWANLRWP